MESEKVCETERRRIAEWLKAWSVQEQQSGVAARILWKVATRVAKNRLDPVVFDEQGWLVG